MTALYYTVGILVGWLLAGYLTMRFVRWFNKGYIRIRDIYYLVLAGLLSTALVIIMLIVTGIGFICHKIHEHFKSLSSN